MRQLSRGAGSPGTETDARLPKPLRITVEPLHMKLDIQTARLATENPILMGVATRVKQDCARAMRSLTKNGFLRKSPTQDQAEIRRRVDVGAHLSICRMFGNAKQRLRTLARRDDFSGKLAEAKPIHLTKQYADERAKGYRRLCWQDTRIIVQT